MDDVTIIYKGNTIAALSAEGSKILKTSGKYCEGDFSINYTPSMGADSDVSGTLEANNDVLLEGNLADGVYTFKYKKNDGTYVEIGTLVLDNKVYYSVTSNLTNCTSSNSETKVVGGAIYDAAITADSGYIVSSIVVTMGGVDITSSAVSGSTITISDITGNIVITAVAKSIPIYTNLVEITDETGSEAFDAGRWTNGARMGSDGTYRSNATTMITNFIPFNEEEEQRVTLYFAGTGFKVGGNGLTEGWNIGVYQTKNGSITKLGGSKTLTEFKAMYTEITDTYYDDGTLKTLSGRFRTDGYAPYYIRLCLSSDLDKSKIIIAKEPIS